MELSHHSRCRAGPSCPTCQYRMDVMTARSQYRKPALPTVAMAAAPVAAPAAAPAAVQRLPPIAKQRKKQSLRSNDEDKELGRALHRSHETAAAEQRRRHAMTATSLSQDQYRALMRDLQTRELSPEDYDLLLRLDDVVQKKNVLDSAAAAALPERNATYADEECAICLAELPLRTSVVALSCCGRAFHPGCIREWLTKSRNACPFCACTCE